MNGVSTRAHPRVRGEHLLRDHKTVWVWGSSPRPRGAPECSGPDSVASGLIPASAGSTYRWWSPGFPSWAHPRVRGEHCRRSRGTPSWTGSSPRPRGALGGVHRVPSSSGLIPASAGSTAKGVVHQFKNRAHPRVRGEHIEHDPLADAGLGSSPRPRGAPSSDGPPSHDVGLIPASAGSTGWSRSAAAPTRAHPRVRGEHTYGPGSIA